MARPQSLRAQLLLRLTLPLTFVVILDAAVSYFVVLHYVDLAYDRWLLDSARSLAQEVKAQKDKVIFELPPIAVEVFRWDETDRTFFKVESRTGGLVAGDKALPTPAIDTMTKEQPLYSDSEFQGRKVRVVSVLTAPTAVSEEVQVSVAETLTKRRSMMSEILLAVVVPQILLVLITGFHVWTGINRGLRPLHELARIIGRRSARDLDPIPDSGVPLEVRSLTHTINALLERLGSAMTTQRRFVENAAHQLRTPLAGLKVQAEHALRGGDLETMKPALAHINNAADRVAHLSTQLLALARSESVVDGGRDFRPVSLAEITRSCCIEWVPKALERNMDLGFESAREDLQIVGNETLLRELLANLLDNAICYGKSGGQIAVKIEARPQPMLIVEDDGPGIETSEAEKVFERFYRVPGSPGPGCGLGLAIVKEIADLHGAQVCVRGGSPGCGTRVEIAFEAMPAGESASRAPP